VALLETRASEKDEAMSCLCCAVPVSLSHAFRFRVQGIKIYDIFITKTSAVSCGRTGIPPARSPLPRWLTHSASTLTLKICSQARQAIIWTWALETAIATAAQGEISTRMMREFLRIMWQKE